MKLVSFSMYGTKPVYLKGAIENAKLMSTIYPNWEMVVYCERGLPTRPLERLGVKIVHMEKSLDQSGMLWRFRPAWTKCVERVIFRDTDSRINVREAAAVAAWEASGKDAHCMHDHRHHASLPLFGGMWGVKGNILKGADTFEALMSKPLPRVGDMHYLQQHVLPQINRSLLRHSSVYTKWEQEPFPEHEAFDGFVGQQYDGDGKQIWV